MVVLKDIIEKIENKAPVSLKESFDNVGLMVGETNKKVEKVLLALDCTLEVIQEAVDKDVDLIITHHPLIFRKPSNITNETLLGRKIIELIRNEIALYSSHTNLDSVKDGLNDTITKLLGYTECEIIQRNPSDEEAGLGRVFDLEQEMTLGELVVDIKERFNLEGLRVVTGGKHVNRIAVINGSGQDFFEKAVKMGADCIITGDTTYHYVSDYKEMGVSVIDIGHFPSEWITYQRVMGKILNEILDIEVVVSTVASDPYSFIS